MARVSLPSSGVTPTIATASALELGETPDELHELNRRVGSDAGLHPCWAASMLDRLRQPGSWRN